MPNRAELKPMVFKGLLGCLFAAQPDVRAPVRYSNKKHSEANLLQQTADIRQCEAEHVGHPNSTSRSDLQSETIVLNILDRNLPGRYDAGAMQHDKLETTGAL